MDPDINRTISYWFNGEEPMKRWFMGGPAVDAEIKDQFSGLVEKARASQLDSWKEQPKGVLALLILLDQFPRNLYRGSPLSYSSDQMAMNITTEAIAKGFDREVEFMQQLFFYLPLMHDENLLTQVACLALIETMAARCSSNPDLTYFMEQATKATKSHLSCILRFGRFPSRNECLGRISTPEELEYLKEYPSGF
jgi:uncharacterized protein (DUF924 family)